jgi:hypothetical protein
METFLKLLSYVCAIYCGGYLLGKVTSWFKINIIDVFWWMLENFALLLFVGGAWYIVWYSFQR